MFFSVIITQLIYDSYLGGVYKWLNVKYAERAFLSALKYLTHTDVQTKCGSPTSEELKPLLTELPREFMFAQDV